MGGILDHDVALCRCMDERTHQAVPILLERPGVEIAGDHQGRRIDIRGVP